MISRSRAIIIKNNQLLTIKRNKEGEVYWVCPGGKIEKGETEEQALIRECKEELGVDIKVLNLFFEMPSEKPETKGQMEYFYKAEIIGGELGTGQGPEFQVNSGYKGSYQLGWVNLDNIKNIDFRPVQLKEKL